MIINVIIAIVLVLLGTAAVFIYRVSKLEDDEDFPIAAEVVVKSIEKDMVYCEVLKEYRIINRECWHLPYGKTVPEGCVMEKTRHLLRVGARGCLHFVKDYIQLELVASGPLTKEQRIEQVRRARRERLVQIDTEKRLSPKGGDWVMARLQRIIILQNS